MVNCYGLGGFGVVWLAERISDGLHVALKQVPKLTAAASGNKTATGGGSTMSSNADTMSAAALSAAAQEVSMATLVRASAAVSVGDEDGEWMRLADERGLATMPRQVILNLLDNYL
jgi:hypothetical protein